jgi:tetratricopeptide (TPR) repeat protein
MLLGAGLAAAGGCTNFVANSRNADGVTLFQRGQYQDALAKFQEATYADPGNADGYYNLGATYHRLGRLRSQPESLAQAETCYRQCLDRNPNHRDCHRGLAVLLIEQNRAPEALALLQNWATQQPSLAEPRMELARLYVEFGNKEMATNTLAEAVQRNPDDARQWAALGKVREESGNYTQALANYQRSLELNPRQPDVAARVTALQASTVAQQQPLVLPPPPGTTPAATPQPIVAGQPASGVR